MYCATTPHSPHAMAQYKLIQTKHINMLSTFVQQTYFCEHMFSQSPKGVSRLESRLKSSNLKSEIEIAI